MLRNSMAAREAPSYFVIDEQIAPYTGSRSGAKKRLPKKTSEGLEFYTLATSNKEYEGYKEDVRIPAQDGELEGQLLVPRDPVCGGYKLNYIMEAGPRYEVGSPVGKKVLGAMILLIF